jgi:hypothetical protein
MGNISNDHKIAKSAIKFTKWPENCPNGHNIYQNRPLQDPQKFTQIELFGLKMYHLATRVATQARKIPTGTMVVTGGFYRPMVVGGP